MVLGWIILFEVRVVKHGDSDIRLLKLLLKLIKVTSHVRVIRALGRLRYMKWKGWLRTWECKFFRVKIESIKIMKAIYVVLLVKYEIVVSTSTRTGSARGKRSGY